LACKLGLRALHRVNAGFHLIVEQARDSKCQQASIIVPQTLIPKMAISVLPLSYRKT
jgi:hypothetical protein